MTKKERAEQVCERLNKEYGTNIKCFLEYDETKPWQLLFATILSAQCTDERVNIVTKDLFKKYPRLEDFANADEEELAKDIYTIGFYRSKSRNIIACAKSLIADFGGELPTDIDDLTSLAGVGRKTANVIRGNIFQTPSVVVDTHVKRVSKLLGLTTNDEPERVEVDLMKILPREQWIPYNHQIILHGRNVCIARRPKCSVCVLADVCKSYSKQ